MVSLTSRSEYFQQFDSDRYAKALVDFLFNKRIGVDKNISFSNANDASIYFLYAIQTEDNRLFSKVFEQITLRKPKPESDWIYNEILLFALTLGVCKFKLNQHWLIDVLDLRISHSYNENKLVAQTLVDILTGNLESKNNFQPLMLVLKYYLDLPIEDESSINSIYDDLVQKNIPYYKSTFLNIISIRAYDIIILLKGMLNREQQVEIQQFVKSFKKRIRQIATIIWFLLLISVFAVSIWFLYYYLTVGPQLADILDMIINFIPFLGFGGLIVPVFKYKEKIISFIEKPFFAYYGFKISR